VGAGERNVPVGRSLQFIYFFVLSLDARHENSLKEGFPFLVIPWMLACISLLEGILMAVLAWPAWFVPGLTGAGLARFGQRYVRGD